MTAQPAAPRRSDQHTQAVEAAVGDAARADAIRLRQAMLARRRRAAPRVLARRAC